MDIAKLRSQFVELYGPSEQEPRIFFAPGRVNLIGEHTDYNGGFVLPCALQYGTCLLIRSNRTRDISLASVNLPFKAVFDAGGIPVKVGNEWTNYPMGVVNEFLKKKILMDGFDMLFAGDIPTGAGLSSSASLEMVTAYALAVMLDAAQLEMTDLIQISKSAENEFVGVNCGIMDMFAIGMGKQDHAIFLNCNTLEYKNVAMVLNGYELIIANTNKPRELAGSKYNERVEECRKAIEALSLAHPVSNLGEIGFMQFFKMQERISDEVIRRRARHVISENQRVLNAVPVLLKGDILQFGALMNASHESLRDNYEVTGPELDALVEEAQKINGCIGARMTGAGFGGCTVNIVRQDIVSQFMEEVGRNYEQRTGLQAAFYLARAGDGVREIVKGE
jgi:galactokinase